MLATRASTAKRLARSFATVVQSASGVKVAAVDNGQPTTSVTLLVKAGSRYEPAPGVAHALKNFAFKSTAKRSTLGIVRESDLYGGVLSTSLSREYLAFTSEFLRGDEPFFTSLLTSVLTTPKFLPHEFSEYVLPVVRDEATAASKSPSTVALETAHALAFHKGLGASLFADSHSPVSLESVKSFAKQVFTSGNVAVVGTGIDSARLAELVDLALADAPLLVGPPVTATPSEFFGGSARIDSHEGPQTFFLSFGSTTPTPVLSVISAYLAPNSPLKWPSAPRSAATVTPVYLPYSDAVLTGLLFQAADAGCIKEAANDFTKKLRSRQPPSADELKIAIARAKFNAAAAFESRDGFVEAIASKIFSDGDISVESTLAGLDEVNLDSFSRHFDRLISGPLTHVVVGDTRALPYSRELAY